MPTDCDWRSSATKKDMQTDEQLNQEILKENVLHIKKTNFLPDISFVCSISDVCQYFLVHPLCSLYVTSIEYLQQQTAINIGGDTGWKWYFSVSESWARIEIKSAFIPWMQSCSFLSSLRKGYNS